MSRLLRFDSSLVIFLLCSFAYLRIYIVLQSDLQYQKTKQRMMPQLKMFIMQNYDHSCSEALQMIGAQFILHLLYGSGPCSSLDEDRLFIKLSTAAFPFKVNQLQGAFGKFYCTSSFKIDEHQNYSFTHDPAALYDFLLVKAQIISMGSDINNQEMQKEEGKEEGKEDMQKDMQEEIVEDEIQDKCIEEKRDNQTSISHENRPLLIKFMSRGSIIQTKQISRDFIAQKSEEEILLYNSLLSIPNMRVEMKRFCDTMSIPHPVYERVTMGNKQYLKAFMAVKTTHGERIFLKATRGYSSYRDGQNQICRDLFKSLWMQNPNIISQYFKQMP